MSDEKRSAQSAELSDEELKEVSGGAVGNEGTSNQLPQAQFDAAEVARRLQGRI